MSSKQHRRSLAEELNRKSRKTTDKSSPSKGTRSQPFDREIFLRSPSYSKLKIASEASLALISKANNAEKFDLESDSGLAACKRFLNSVEDLMHVYSVQASDRGYRKKFSKAYRILYTPPNRLCYLSEILDSA